jgi:hypothetical protein
VKWDGIIGLDLLRLMRAKINLETDYLQVGSDRIPMRKTTVGIARSDRPFAEERRTERDARREAPRSAKESGARTPEMSVVAGQRATETREEASVERRRTETEAAGRLPEEQRQTKLGTSEGLPHRRSPPEEKAAEEGIV